MKSTVREKGNAYIHVCYTRKVRSVSFSVVPSLLQLLYICKADRNYVLRVEVSHDDAMSSVSHASLLENVCLLEELLGIRFVDTILCVAGFHGMSKGY